MHNAYLIFNRVIDNFKERSCIKKNTMYMEITLTKIQVEFIHH